MQELKKVLSGHLGQVVFLAGKVTIKAHLHLEQWSQGSVYRPKIEDPIPKPQLSETQKGYGLRVVVCPRSNYKLKTLSFSCLSAYGNWVFGFGSSVFGLCFLDTRSQGSHHLTKSLAKLNK